MANENGPLEEYVAREFERIEDEFVAVRGRFDEMDKRFDGVDQRFDGVDQRFDSVEARLEKLDAGQNTLKETMELGFQTLREEIQSVLADHGRRITALEQGRGRRS